ARLMSRMVEQNDRADVDQPLDAMADARGNDVLCAPDGTRFESGLAARHGRSNVINEVDSADGMVNGLGVAQVTVYDFDVWIRGELGCWTPHEDPDDLTTLTQTAQQRPPKEAARTCDQDFRRRYGWGR